MKRMLVSIGGGAVLMAVYRIAIDVFSAPGSAGNWMTSRPSGPSWIHALPCCLGVGAAIILKRKAIKTVMLELADSYDGSLGFPTRMTRTPVSHPRCRNRRMCPFGSSTACAACF